MKKEQKPSNAGTPKKGYNEKNPGQSQGAFPPASGKERPEKNNPKSNAADKKEKEDQN